VRAVHRLCMAAYRFGAHRIDLPDIQRVLGHADPATTMRSYLEPIDTAVIDRAAQHLDQLAALGAAGARGMAGGPAQRDTEPMRRALLIIGILLLVVGVGVLAIGVPVSGGFHSCGSGQSLYGGYQQASPCSNSTVLLMILGFIPVVPGILLVAIGMSVRGAKR
jgi:hypothetical protein